MKKFYEIEWEKDGEVTVRDAYGNSIAWYDADESLQLVEDGFIIFNNDDSLLEHLVRENKIGRYITGTGIMFDDSLMESDDCTIRQYEDAKAAIIDYAEKSIGKKVDNIYTEEVYGGGIAMYVETEDGYVYSGYFLQADDWKLQFGIHPDEEYYECLVIHGLHELGPADFEWTDETRSQKGEAYVREIRSAEREKREKEVHEMGFSKWMKEVDALVYKKLGVSVHDLPDMRYRDFYDDMVDPETFVYEDLLPEVQSEFGYAFGEEEWED